MGDLESDDEKKNKAGAKESGILVLNRGKIEVPLYKRMERKFDKEDE